MEKVIKYYCDHCGAMFTDEESCKAHEAVCVSEKAVRGRQLAKELAKIIYEAHMAHIRIDALCDKDILAADYNVETGTIVFLPF